MQGLCVLGPTRRTAPLARSRSVASCRVMSCACAVCKAREGGLGRPVRGSASYGAHGQHGQHRETSETAWRRFRIIDGRLGGWRAYGRDRKGIGENVVL